MSEQPNEAFCEAYYNSHLTHALDALREGRPYEVNADGAFTLIQQAAADRKALKALEARTPAPEREVVAWRVRRPTAAAGFGRPQVFLTDEASDGDLKQWRRNGYEVQPLYASPVVPVGVSREEIIKAVRPVLDRPPMIDSSQSHKLDIQAGKVADAILAALGTKATDTGREG